METQDITNNYKHCEDDHDEAAGLLALTACGCVFLPMVLNAAIQLDIFEIIGEAGDGAYVSASHIVSRIPTQNREAARVVDSMLRLLVSYSLLTCSTSRLRNGDIERRYGLSQAGKLYVRDEHGVSLGQFHALSSQKKVMDVGYRFKDAVLNEGGTLFERAYGKTYYEYMMSSGSEDLKMFEEAMGAHSTLLLRKLVRIYNGFEGLNSIVNVGGGNGSTLDMIHSKYPHIHGINFDLPEVIQNAPSYNGVEHVAGDMFVEVPRGDAILLKFILHNWSDDQCQKLLTNCYKSLPNKGKVMVIDVILPEIPQTDLHSKFVSQMDIIMLTIFGGKERTKSEFQTMAVKAGFSEFKVVCTAYGLWIMEFIK